MPSNLPHTPAPCLPRILTPCQILASVPFQQFRHAATERLTVHRRGDSAAKIRLFAVPASQRLNESRAVVCSCHHDHNRRIREPAITVRCAVIVLYTELVGHSSSSAGYSPHTVQGETIPHVPSQDSAMSSTRPSAAITRTRASTHISSSICSKSLMSARINAISESIVTAHPNRLFGIRAHSSLRTPFPFLGACQHM